MSDSIPSSKWFDLNRTLTQIEGNDWGPPTYGSHLVTTVHALRYKLLRDFTVEDLRIMIGQNFSLPILIPLAIERLRSNPSAAGDMYPGDLLLGVLRSDPEHWRHYSNQWQGMIGILDDLDGPGKDLEYELALLQPNLGVLVERFRGLPDEGAHPQNAAPSLRVAILKLLGAGKWLEAARLYSDGTGESMREAVKAADAIAEQHGLQRQSRGNP